MKNIISNMVYNFTAVKQLYTCSGTIYLNPYTAQERFEKLILVGRNYFTTDMHIKSSRFVEQCNSKIKQHIKNGYQN